MEASAQSSSDVTPGYVRISDTHFFSRYHTQNGSDEDYFLRVYDPNTKTLSESQSPVDLITINDSVAYDCDDTNCYFYEYFQNNHIYILTLAQAVSSMSITNYSSY